MIPPAQDLWSQTASQPRFEGAKALSWRSVYSLYTSVPPEYLHLHIVLAAPV